MNNELKLELISVIANRMIKALDEREDEIEIDACVNAIRLISSPCGELEESELFNQIHNVVCDAFIELRHIACDERYAFLAECDDIDALRAYGKAYRRATNQREKAYRQFVRDLTI